MKQLVWLGDSKKALLGFSAEVRSEAGFQLGNLQHGGVASDFKPMPSVGKGVEEIRLWAESGTYRVIYIARFKEAVYVLHAFQKKSQQTSPKDIALARSRFEKLVADRTS